MSIEGPSQSEGQLSTVGFICGPTFQFLDAPVTDLVGHVRSICLNQTENVDGKYHFKKQGFEGYLLHKLQKKATEIDQFNAKVQQGGRQKKGRCNFRELADSIHGDPVSSETCIPPHSSSFDLNQATFDDLKTYKRISTDKTFVMPNNATTDHIRDRYARLGADYVKQLITCTDLSTNKLFTYTSDGKKKFNLFRFDIFLVMDHKTDAHGKMLFEGYNKYPSSCQLKQIESEQKMFLRLCYLAFCKNSSFEESGKSNIGIKFISNLSSMYEDIVDKVVRRGGGNLFGPDDNDTLQDCVSIGAYTDWTYMYVDAGAYDHAFKLHLRTFADYYPSLNRKQLKKVWGDEYFLLVYNVALKKIGDRLVTELRDLLKLPTRGGNSILNEPPSLHTLREAQAKLANEQRCFLFRDVKYPYHEQHPIPEWIRDGFKTQTADESEFARTLYFLLLQSGQVRLKKEHLDKITYRSAANEELEAFEYPISTASAAIVFHLVISQILYDRAYDTTAKGLPLHLTKWHTPQMVNVPTCWVLLHELIITMNVPRYVTNAFIGYQQTLEIYDLLVMAVVGGYINQQAATFPSATLSELSTHFRLFRYSLIRTGLGNSTSDFEKLRTGQLSKEVVNRYFDAIRSNMIGMLPSAGFTMVHGGYHLIDSALEKDPGITESSIGNMYGKELPYITTLALENPETQDSLFTHRRTLQNAQRNYLQTYGGPQMYHNEEVEFLGASQELYQQDSSSHPTSASAVLKPTKLENKSSDSAKSASSAMASFLTGPAAQISRSSPVAQMLTNPMEVEIPQLGAVAAGVLPFDE